MSKTVTHSPSILWTKDTTDKLISSELIDCLIYLVNIAPEVTQTANGEVFVSTTLLENYIMNTGKITIYKSIIFSNEVEILKFFVIKFC